MKLDMFSYLNSLGQHRVKPGIDRIKALLGFFDNPHSKAPSIIVGGTNGKGSVASAISSVLSAQGYKVGLYTSPHLVRVTERISINETEIRESDLSDTLRCVKDLSERQLAEPLSYFEFLTAAAFLYFAESSVDFNVLEVGMGGRWDATNIVTPLVSVITNISKDHTEYLGNTTDEIAYEKALIIKPGVPCVTAVRGSSLKIILAQAERVNSDVRILGKDFTCVENNSGNLTYSGKTWMIENVESSLVGYYQISNLTLAIAALETLSDFNEVQIDEQNLRQGLSRIKLEGRFEIIRDDPPLIMDGAHNSGAAKSLVESLTKSFPGRRFTFLVGMLSDKDHQMYIKEVSAVADKIIFTEVPSPRTIKARDLARKAEPLRNKFEILANYEKAWDKVISLKSPACVTGSLHLIGSIKNLL